MHGKACNCLLCSWFATLQEHTESMPCEWSSRGHTEWPQMNRSFGESLPKTGCQLGSSRGRNVALNNDTPAHCRSCTCLARQQTCKREACRFERRLVAFEGSSLRIVQKGHSLRHSDDCLLHSAPRSKPFELVPF